MLSSIYGTIVDPIQKRQYKGTIRINNGHITDIEEKPDPSQAIAGFILPGFVDAHIHIESSMLTPAEFAKAVYRFGTVAVLCDPHEIANVLGIEGIELLINNAHLTPMKVYFCAPSCVPATTFETNGATIDVAEIERLLQMPEVLALGEVMNVPGVLHDDEDLMSKIACARTYGKKIDGHAPLLKGDGLKKYVAAGISTDHECTTIEEAEEKIHAGMLIQIREGSAARNFDELWPLLTTYPKKCMLCSDDKHPDSLEAGHMDVLCRRAISNGVDVMDVLQAVSVNPVRHYGMSVGLLQEGDSADFICVDNLNECTVKKTVINGNEIIGDEGESAHSKIVVLNTFEAKMICIEDIEISSQDGKMRVIGVTDGELLTEELHEISSVEGNRVVSDPARDILKIVVVNRYAETKPIVGFVHGFGLKHGAIASSVAHDSHNIIVVGVEDVRIVAAVNELVRTKGGLCCVGEAGEISALLPLPIAGLVSDKDYETVKTAYDVVEQAAKDTGTALRAPFMTLSFLALLVIPALKIGDKGLFDGKAFEFVDLFVGGKDRS